MTPRSPTLLLGALLWSLACAGLPMEGVDLADGAHTTAGEAPTLATFTTDAPRLIQTRTGLWTPEGERLLELGGQAFDDLYLIDATRDGFFLLAENGVHVAQRQGNQFTVKRLRDDGFVERPIDRLALVRTSAPDSEPPTRVLMDLQGEVLYDEKDQAETGAKGHDPPVDHPEYWWSADYMHRPVPFATRQTFDDGMGWGWIRPDGEWIAGSGSLPPAMHSLPAWDGQDFIIDIDGEVRFHKGSSDSILGSPSEGRFLVLHAGPEAQPEVSVMKIEDGRAEVRAPLSLATGPHLPYQFHGDRIAVVFSDDGTTRAYGYLDPTLQTVIGPDTCRSPVRSGPFVEGRAFHCVDDEYWLIDADGARIAGPWKPWVPLDAAAPVAPDLYPRGLFFAEGLAAVPVEGGWAYIDREGQVVLPGPYSRARPFRLGVATVGPPDDPYVINKAGARMFEP